MYLIINSKLQFSSKIYTFFFIRSYNSAKIEWYTCLSFEWNRSIYMRPECLTGLSQHSFKKNHGSHSKLYPDSSFFLKADFGTCQRRHIFHMLRNLLPSPQWTTDYVPGGMSLCPPPPLGVLLADPTPFIHAHPIVDFCFTSKLKINDVEMHW